MKVFPGTTAPESREEGRVREPLDLNAVGTESLTEAADHFLYQGPHGSHVDHFEVIDVDCSVGVDVFADFVKHGHQGNIGLTRSLRRCIAEVTRG